MSHDAIALIGKHTFTVSGWTVTRGGEHGTSRTAGYSHGTSQSHGWAGSGLFPASAFGADTRSRRLAEPARQCLAGQHDTVAEVVDEGPA